MSRNTRIPRFNKLIHQSLNKLKDQAESHALEAYIGDLARHANKTLAKFLETITKDGAIDYLMGIEMSRIASTMISATKGKRGRRKIVAAGGRLSKAEKAKLQAEILAFVKANPDCRKKEIARGLKLPSKKLFSAVKGLLAEKKLTTKGKKAGMTYSLKG